jgi:hypothetical protein
MIDGNIKDFMDNLYYGEEMLIEYHHVRYFIQGWWKDVLYHLEIWDYSNPENYEWHCEYPTQEACVEAFLKMPHWNGKTFDEVENELIWSENWD